MFPASANGTTEFPARNAVGSWFCGRLPKGRMPGIGFTGVLDSRNAAIRGRTPETLRFAGFGWGGFLFLPASTKLFFQGNEQFSLGRQLFKNRNVL